MAKLDYFVCHFCRKSKPIEERRRVCYAISAGDSPREGFACERCAALLETEMEIADDIAVHIEPKTEERCERCGRSMVVKEGKYGEFLACSGYPECKNTKPVSLVR